jgi:hypothetical protein
MANQIADRREAAADSASPSVKKSRASVPTMTGVQCGSCGARYETTVDPKIVKTIKGCAECGQRALAVIA